MMTRDDVLLLLLEQHIRDAEQALMRAQDFAKRLSMGDLREDILDLASAMEELRECIPQATKQLHFEVRDEGKDDATDD